MELMIIGLELKTGKKGCYVKMTFLDKKNNTYVVERPVLKDYLNFRYFINALLQVSDTNDLLRLSSNEPKSKKVICYIDGTDKILENKKHQWFIYDKESNSYHIKNANGKEIKAINALVREGKVRKTNATIDYMELRKNRFEITFNLDADPMFFRSEEVTYGLGQTDFDKAKSKEQARKFTTFITAIMKFYGVTDLLDLSGNLQKYPSVNAKVVDGNVVWIENPFTGARLRIGTRYELVMMHSKENGIRLELK